MKAGGRLFLMGATVGTVVTSMLAAFTKLFSSDEPEPQLIAAQPCDGVAKKKRRSEGVETHARRDGQLQAGAREKRTLRKLRSKVARLEEQRDEAVEELSMTEAALLESETPPPYEFSVSAEEWQSLAPHGFIKYRIPCLQRPESGWNIDAALAKRFGWSPQETETIMEAFWRSNERVWSVIRPLCLNVLPDEVAVDRLGATGCQSLVESSAKEKDPMAVRHAKQQVGQVRGGLQPPPGSAGEASGLFQMYMVLTGEGDHFEAELAEEFGPAVAQEVWHSFPCSHFSGGRTAPRASR